MRNLGAHAVTDSEKALSRAAALSGVHSAGIPSGIPHGEVALVACGMVVRQDAGLQTREMPD